MLNRFACFNALACALPLLLSGGAQAQSTAHPALWPSARSGGLVDARTEVLIDQLLAKLTLEEKVGQIIQADISTVRPEDLKTYPFGSVLAGGSSPPLNAPDRSALAPWVETVRAYRAAAAARPGGTHIPLLFGIDAVHGNNNIIGATLFPHNIGLGAMRDPALMRKIGQATARETAASGFDWAFGPTLTVPRDDRWGRTYEGYSEDPEIVRSYAAEMVLGLQGVMGNSDAIQQGHVAASAKHFLGDGGTFDGHDQGDTRVSEDELIRIHAQGYVPAIKAGALTIMASFSSWNGEKMHGNSSLLTDVLKGRMGFDGLVVGDWDGHGQVKGCTPTSCARAINAGLDMFMSPEGWKGLFDNTLAQAKSGEISRARLDDAVRRVLRVKFKLGLFAQARPWEGRDGVLGSAEHRALARQAVRQSLVLLKNSAGLLPLKANARILVAGAGADDIGRQSGGWTLSWQGDGNSNSDFPNAQSIFAGLKAALAQGGGSAALSVDGRFTSKPDAAVVVFGEQPYAEGVGDLRTLEYQPGDKTDLALLKRLKAAGVPVVAVFLSGRPLWVNPELNAADAFVAAWLPGSEGGGVADVLVGDAAGKPRHDFHGKLSFSWPMSAAQTSLNRGDKGYAPLFAYGFGLRYADKNTRWRALPEVAGVSAPSANVGDYFVSGRTPAPFAFKLSPEGGAVQLRAVDADGIQEAGRQISFAGGSVATVALLSERPVDLSGQADMALQIDYRLDSKPSAAVSVAMDGARLDLSPLLAAAPLGEWQSARVPLKCFQAAGADLGKLRAPFVLATGGRLVLSLKRVKLSADVAGGACPARAG